MRLLETVPRACLLPMALIAATSTGACADDLVASDTEPSECIDGQYCIGDQICVDGLCVDPGSTETASGDGDPATGDGDPTTGDGDGDGGPACGNGIVEEGEACDDGNADNNDNCLDTCEEASCGDGFVGPGEGCDDGNMVDDDECTNACALASCGDGVVQDAEQCDDGDADDTDNCLSTCVFASCGDGFTWQGVEECDDGDADNTDDCLDSCDVASCGDGFVQAGVEECDDGDADNTDDCLDSCDVASCGDGFVQAGVEECDDGNNVNTDTCLSGCVAASCGDGFVGPGEACDDGNNNNNDDCTNACALASCGDGVVGPGEDCDDGNNFNTDACLNTCVSASCGDGFLYEGVEGCDDGNADNTDACLNSCVGAICGDGFTQQGVEACDDGNAVNTDACLNSCEDASCGDGFVWAGQEQCDDQNNVNTDACLNSCADASCGDGFVWVGQEQCDDQNNINTDACLNSCEDASCGDGFVWAGQEQCDDQNQDDDDGCVGSTCTLPFCGDGIAQPNAGEDCDDGNADNADACLNNCSAASCGDAIVWAGVEACDDGDNDALDGCENDCTRTAVLDVATGDDHTCALFAGNTLRCWGGNDDGQLGLGNTVTIGDQPNELPAPAVDTGGTVIDVGLGYHLTCALYDTGEVRCWGYNGQGQLGRGNTADIGDGPNEMPPAPIDLGGFAVALGVGSYSACALLDDDTVRCWGRNAQGQLGHGDTENIGDGPNEMPPAPTDVGGTPVQLSVGASHSCVLLDTGAVRCWGEGGWGRLGIGSAEHIGDQVNEMPPADSNFGVGTVVKVEASAFSTFVLFDNGDLTCAGNNTTGSCASGNTQSIGDQLNELPPPLINYGGGAMVDIRAGTWVTTLYDDGAVRTWGANGGYSYPPSWVNHLGDEPNEVPTPDVNLGGFVTMISQGVHARHSCAVYDDDSIHCWGRGEKGQLGIGSTLLVGTQVFHFPPAAAITY